VFCDALFFIRCVFFINFFPLFFWGGGGGYNFFISNMFSMIVSVLDVPTRRVQILFEHQKQ